MIGAIYSLINKIWKLLSSFQRNRNAAFWGNGELGDMYIGPNPEHAPAGYQITNTSSHVFPMTAIFRYRNLIIDCPCTFQMSPVVVQASESITVLPNGHLHVDNLGSNARNAYFLYTSVGTSPVLQLSKATGASTSPNGTLLIRTYFANNLPTSYKVELTGASKNNKGVSNGGSIGCSGGLVLIYTEVGNLIAEASNVTANGSANDGNGGGMLSLLSPKIIIEGKVSADGTTGAQAVTSSLNYVPNENQTTTYGGAGCAMAFEVLDKSN